MTLDEKLEMIENVLSIPPNTLSETALLADIPEWDSLAMMNLQIECTMRWPELSFDDLHACETVGDICKLCGKET